VCGVGSGWASVMAEVGGGIGSDDDGDGTHEGNERRREEIITRQLERTSCGKRAM